MGLCNHPCQGWGPVHPASPLPQARGSPGHRHGLGWPPEKPIFAFSPVNSWSEECGVTTCAAPQRGSCMRRDAGTSPFGSAIYFLNICGRKRERGERGAEDGPGGLADRASAKGQRVREAGQRFPTTPNGPCHPAQTLLSLHLLPQPFWIRSAAVGLLSCALPLPPAQPSADAARHAGANRCLHKKPLQGEWARSRREQGFSSFQ